jgi:hypothetical protein
MRERMDVRGMKMDTMGTLDRREKSGMREKLGLLESMDMVGERLVERVEVITSRSSAPPAVAPKPARRTVRNTTPG